MGCREGDSSTESRPDRASDQRLAVVGAACERRHAAGQGEGSLTSRINPQQLLLPRRSWINVRPVELRCASTWQNHIARQPQVRRCPNVRRYHISRCHTGGPLARQWIIGSDSRRSSSVFIRAYSSIGQSPRLITGLFLVRTQVGPLSVSFRSPAFRPASGEAPSIEPVAGWLRGSAPLRTPNVDRRGGQLAGARRRRGEGEWMERSRSGTAERQHGNEEPTYL
jgi:hypothetical protein